MMQDIHKQFVAVLIVLAVLAGVAVADSASLKEKLAQDVDIELTDVTIAEALEQIGQQAGITIELTDEAAWKLPAGAQTRLSVTLEGQLAQGLEQMLNEFFLRYAVGSESVVVYPRSELRHILGRPTPRLLKLLGNIYTKGSWIVATPELSGSSNEEGFVQGVVNGLAGEAVVIRPLNRFDDIAFVTMKIARRNYTSDRGTSSVGKAPTMLAVILDEVAARRSDWVWFVAAPEFPDQPLEIHVEESLDYGRALFGQIVDVSFENEEGLTVLRKLAAMANIDLQIVGENALGTAGLRRRISLDALNVTVREALNRVTVALGASVGTVNFERGTYEVIPPSPTSTSVALEPVVEGADVYEPSSPEAADDYVGKISIPMGEGQNRYYIEFMLRERDLPDALKQLRAEKIREIFESFSDSAEAN